MKISHSWFRIKSLTVLLICAMKVTGGMRVVIELRHDVVPDVILNQLYKHTKMQDSFGIIMLALVKNQPMVLNLKQILSIILSTRKKL